MIIHKYHILYVNIRNHSEVFYKKLPLSKTVLPKYFMLNPGLAWVKFSYDGICVFLFGGSVDAYFVVDAELFEESVEVWTYVEA